MSSLPTRACFAADPSLAGAGLRALEANRNRNNNASLAQAGDQQRTPR